MKDEELDIYDQWSFFREQSWIDFSRSHNTTTLAVTEEYVVGIETIKHSRLPCSLFQFVEMEVEPDLAILGMPLTYKDVILDKLVFQGVEDTNLNERIDKQMLYSGNDVIFKIMVQHHMVVDYIQYYHFGDIFAKIGGYHVLIEKLLLHNIAPAFVLIFLVTLCQIIKNRYKLNYRKKLIEILLKY